jgi:hypothetical protein
MVNAACRVHIDVPNLEARVMRILHKLRVLNLDFKDPTFKRRFGSIGTPSTRLEDLNLSWREQNKRIRDGI